MEASGLDQLDCIARRGRADEVRHPGAGDIVPTIPVSEEGSRRKSPTEPASCCRSSGKQSARRRRDQRVLGIGCNGIDLEVPINQVLGFENGKLNEPFAAMVGVKEA